MWFVSINIGLISYLVAQSQVQNLLSNKQTLASFDIRELRDNMGIQGLKVFNSLETQAIASNYPYLKELKTAIAKLDNPMTDDEDDDTAENLANNIKQDPYKNVSLLPSALNISPDDLSKIRLATETSESDCTPKTPCVLSIEKLNTKDPKENFYIYIRGQKENRYPSVLYIHPKDGKVHELYTSSIDLDKKYKEDSIEATQPIIQDIRIGNKIFRINESDIKFIFSNEADE